MMATSPVFYLPGASGGSPDVGVLRTVLGDFTRVETVSYPGWKRYVADDFSPERLVVELVDQIASKAPEGPIRLVGLSLGGHFGYAAALQLQAMGREVEGFCAIDSFMVESAAPSAGWKGRALARGWELLRQRRFAEFMAFMRSKFWRSLMRLSRGRLPDLMRKFSSSGQLPAALAVDTMFEEELSLRLLIREVAPWVASLDREPKPLTAPAILLRTQLTARDDEAWHRRCPNIEICEVPGHHHSLLEPENIGSLRDAYLTATREWA
jgi:thioesterase domain-containing protein